MVRGSTASRILAVFTVVVLAAALVGQGFGVFPPAAGSGGSGLPSGCTDAGGGAIQCTGGFIAGDGTVQSSMALPELTANGSSEWGLFGPVSLAADRLYIMPTADSNSGDCLSDSGTTDMTTEAVPRTATILEWVPCDSATPTITSFANATHTHADSAGGGQLGVTAVSATGTPSSTTYWRGDNTWATPSGGSSTWHHEWDNLATWQASTRYNNTSTDVPMVDGDAGSLPFFLFSNTETGTLLLETTTGPTAAGYSTNGAITLSFMLYASASGVTTFNITGACFTAGAGFPSYSSTGTVSVTAVSSQFIIAAGVQTINCAANQVVSFKVNRDTGDANSSDIRLKTAWASQ